MSADPQFKSPEMQRIAEWRAAWSVVDFFRLPTEGAQVAWANVKIDRFEIDEDKSRWSLLRAQCNGHFRYVRVGSYARLLIGGELMMSDTHDEFVDHLPLFKAAHERGGRVLLNGLGLGCAARVLLSMPNVESVTCIERSVGVLRLTGTLLRLAHRERFKPVRGDAFKYEPKRGERYNIVWHDIWPTIGAANLPQMKRLHRKWARRCVWQASWMREGCEDQARRIRERHGAVLDRLK